MILLVIQVIIFFLSSSCKLKFFKKVHADCGMQTDIYIGKHSRNSISSANSFPDPEKINTFLIHPCRMKEDRGSGGDRTITLLSWLSSKRQNTALAPCPRFAGHSHKRNCTGIQDLYKEARYKKLLYSEIITEAY